MQTSRISKSSVSTLLNSSSRSLSRSVSFYHDDQFGNLGEEKVEEGLRRLIKNQKFNEIDGKILKGLVNEEDEGAE